MHAQLGADDAVSGIERACTSKGSWHTAQMAEPCPALAPLGDPAALGAAAAAAPASRAAVAALCTTRYGWFTACKGNFVTVNLGGQNTFIVS